MPMRKELYPKNWKEIAFQIKQKANWKCMQCGKQCHLRYDAKHHAESKLAKREQEQNHD